MTSSRPGVRLTLLALLAMLPFLASCDASPTDVRPSLEGEWRRVNADGPGGGFHLILHGDGTFEAGHPSTRPLPATGTWQSDERQGRLTVHQDHECLAGEGRYEYTLSGTRLELRALFEPCGPRRDVLQATWERVS